MDKQTLGVTDSGTLMPCPAKPNCRCSDAVDDDHRITPLVVKGEAGVAWEALVAHITSQPRMTIVSQNDDYLHVEARTRLLRFTDDMEFHRRDDQGQIAMRSASRVGYSDMGANKKRLESVRAALVTAGVVQP